MDGWRVETNNWRHVRNSPWYLANILYSIKLVMDIFLAPPSFGMHGPNSCDNARVRSGMARDKPRRPTAGSLLMRTPLYDAAEPDLGIKCGRRPHVSREYEAGPAAEFRAATPLGLRAPVHGPHCSTLASTPASAHDLTRNGALRAAKDAPETTRAPPLCAPPAGAASA